MEKIKFIKDKNWDELPKTAGVYFFYNKPKARGQKQEAIYIGKAINIKDRVKSHFQQPSYRDNLYIRKVDKIGYIETNSEIEALILEANLIKKHQPKFNVIWRDDKNYFYVAIENNKDKIPYVFITHQPQKNIQDTRYKIQNTSVGPFTEGNSLKKTLRFLRKVFPYYTFSKHPKLKCTYCHLDLCPGPSPDLNIYRNNIKKLILVLSGKKNSVLKSLKREMGQLAKEKKFEEAGKIRDQIYNLQQIMAHTSVIENKNISNLSLHKFDDRQIYARTRGTSLLQKIIGLDKPIDRIECYDISNIQGKFATGSMIVFVNGKPDKSQYKRFKIKLGNTPNDIAMLKEVLNRRLSHPEWQYPDVILIDGGRGQLNAALEIKNSFKISNLKLKIKVISIAKGRQELFIENREDAIALNNLPQEVKNLILSLDAEAHRFAITYHKKLRKKNLIK